MIDHFHEIYVQRASRRKEDDDSDDDETPTDQEAQSPVVWPDMNNTNLRLFIGKDYSNVYQKDAHGLDRFYEGQSYYI